MLSRRASIKAWVLGGIGCAVLRSIESNGWSSERCFSEHEVEEISVRAMGSEMNVRWKVSDGNNATAKQVRDETSALLEKWNAILSDYDDESEASILSRPQNIGRWQSVSIELADALTRSGKWFEISQGAFDVTCGAVTALRRKRRVVSAEEWQAAIQTMGWDAVLWEPEKREIKIDREGVKFDFGGIGKGLVVDKVSEMLGSLGINQFIVNFSGNLRAGNPPEDRDGWPVELESIGDGPSEVKVLYRFRLANLSMATSGDQFQRFPDWKSQTPKDRTSHILDPQDGGGITRRQLVTAFSPQASDADAAATAACVQLRRNNRSWLEELSQREPGMFGVAQEIVDGESRVIEFGGFSDKLKFNRS
jgi:thiamine biosynthesis lipoprotein